MQILLAKPRGFCAGVNRAISIVNRALEIYGSPIYVYHEIVHNNYVVNSFRQRGVIFVERITEVPDCAILIFSAHGVSKAVQQEAKNRCMTMLLDATCPLVSRVHMEVARASNKGKEVILIGHPSHPEMKGTIGQYNNPFGGIYFVESTEDVWKLQVKNPNNLCFMTQTTLSVEETAYVINSLSERFPNITGPYKDNICYATINRQQAVKELLPIADIILVIGSKNSSNSNRLVELAQKSGKPSYLVESTNNIQEHWFKNVKIIGLTAGASTPNILVFYVIEYLKKLGVSKIIELPGHEENVIFKVPKKLYT